MKPYKIAIALAARSGLHKTIGMSLANIIKHNTSYKADIFFTGFDQGLIKRQIKQVLNEEYDVLFTIGYIFTRETARYFDHNNGGLSSKTKVVFAGVKWPIEQGIVRSARRPGGILTGVVREGASPFMPAYLVESLPLSFKKIVIPYSPFSEGGYLLEQGNLIVDFLKRKDDIKFKFVPLEDTETIVATIEPYLDKGADLLLSLEGCMLTEAASTLSALCQEYGVYLFGDGPEAVRAGADFGYGSNNEVFAHRALRLMRKICEQGADPATVPLTVVPNNRAYWINTRLLDRGIISRAQAKQLEIDLDTKVHWLDTVHEARNGENTDS